MTSVSRAIVASTNPILNNKICLISGRRNTLDKPVMVGERRGRNARAVLDCSKVDIKNGNRVNAGSFRCLSNSDRISDRLAYKMSKKIGWL